MNAEHSKELRIVPKIAILGTDLLQPYFEEPFDRIYKIPNSPIAKTLMVVEGVFRRDLSLIKVALRVEEGVCLPNYNAYIAPDTNSLAKMHEEVHLRVYRLYPSRSDLLFKAAFDKDYENNNSAAFQRGLVEFMINEGAADFISIEAITRHSKDPYLRADAMRRHNLLLYNNEYGGTDADYQKWMRKIFQRDEKIVQAYEALLPCQNPFIFLRAYRELVHLIYQQSYSTGYNFVAHGMNVLRASSIPDPEALRMIMNQQPVTVAELTDPVGFIQALIP